MSRRPDPLDASERALADLLARDASPGPSPELDARILAAARASSSPARRLRHARPRWIAGVGIAATVVLAVGLAWRMRPLPERPLANGAPAMVSTARVVGSAKNTASPATDTMQAPALPAAAPAVYIPGPSADSARARETVHSPPPEAPVVYDEPAPMEVLAPAIAAPPPPPAAASPATRMPAPAAEAFRADSAQPQAQKAAGNLDRIEATGSRINAAEAADAAASGAAVPSQAELDEEPPATADSPIVQEAWLQRIRDLLAAGDSEAARRSLSEFSHRYPKYALPDDLRHLATP